MASENMFFMWSILEAWEWLINLPFLGFFLLLIIPFIAVIIVLYVSVIWATMFE